MKIYHCNIFDLRHRADAICVTTNAVVRSNGSAVMGAGVAKYAKQLFYGIDKALGAHLKANGNTPAIISVDPITKLDDKLTKIVSFPTKHNWKDKSNLELIEQSSILLANMISYYKWEKVAITKPGCGNGGLKWHNVEPIIEKHLPNIFVCDFKY